MTPDAANAPRALAYCGFLQDAAISLPQFGLNGEPVREMAEGRLRVLWSEPAWPFAPESMQRHAVEFHRVVSHVFRQVAVAPFRLLSVFDGQRALADFVSMRRETLIADLERLRGSVQMECVIFFKSPPPSDFSSGQNYLRQKAGLRKAVDELESRVRQALAQRGVEVRAREVKLGSRMFCLVERGQEKRFSEIVREVPVPSPLERRVSGPWPAAEFLSDALKRPPAQPIS